MTLSGRAWDAGDIDWREITLATRARLHTNELNAVPIVLASLENAVVIVYPGTKM